MESVLRAGTAPAAQPAEAAPAPRLEYLEGFGRYDFAVSWVYRPRSAAELAAAIADARRRGLSICFRGAGRSYGDAALNQGGAVIETTALDRILAFDADTGIVHAEAGCTIGDLWRFAVPRGFWPPVVPGTMHVTLGGAAAMNIHGKNNWQAGPFGEHVTELGLLRPDGTQERCGPERHPELFRAVVSGAGRLGCITDLKVKLNRVHSGYLEVRAEACGDLPSMLALVDRAKSDWHYVVGWIDCFARGRALGRGLVHVANYLAPDHPRAGQGLTVAAQSLPARFFGVVPAAILWRLVRPFANNAGMRAVNALKYLAGRLRSGHTYHQSHAAYAFLLDYVPDWRNIYLPGGFIQYHLFVPKEHARAVLSRAVELQHQLGVVAFLGVLKRHRPDAFAMTHAVDGFSLALDLPVTRANASALRRLCAEYDALLERSGGRVYLAKDSVSRCAPPPHVRERAPGIDSNQWRRVERAAP
jgi:FAD/FMN-containing dehydrogenase